MRRWTGFLALALGLLVLTLGPSVGRSAGPAEAPRTVTILVGDARLDFRDLGGPGRPLLLIPGYAVTMDMWDPIFVDRLAARSRVILMDNRGMGSAKAPDGPMTISQMARDAAGLLAALGLAKADVLGWSMGGMIAQELALARPDLVGSLALYATVPDNQGLMPVLERMASMTPDQFHKALFPATWAAAHPDIFSRLPRPVRPPDPEVVARQYAAMAGWNGTLERLSGLAGPVLLLVGADDWVCPVQESARMAGTIPHARIQVLPQAGHWMMHQYPEEMARLVEEFLAPGRSEGLGHRPVSRAVEPGSGLGQQSTLPRPRPAAPLSWNGEGRALLVSSTAAEHDPEKNI